MVIKPMCDCWICRLHERPFEMSECPHPHYSHAGDQDGKAEYVESDFYKENYALQKKRPRYVLVRGFLEAKLVWDDGREEKVN